MIVTFHADDYGINLIQTKRILECAVPKGILNSVSIMPNSKHLSESINILSDDIKIGIHINLAEGEPCAIPETIPLLVKNGVLYRGFFSLAVLSIFKHRELEEQATLEILSQIKAVTSYLKPDYKIRIDSHVHCHMIPVIFKAMCKALKQCGYRLEHIRIPDEKILIYMCTPSVWRYIHLINLFKAVLLKFLGKIDNLILRKYQIRESKDLFFGTMFTSEMYGPQMEKILNKYIAHAKKTSKNIEVLFHPGGIFEGEEYLEGCNDGFKAVYSSENRYKEAMMLQNLRGIKK